MGAEAGREHGNVLRVFTGGDSSVEEVGDGSGHIGAQLVAVALVGVFPMTHVRDDAGVRRACGGRRGAFAP
jgi:hypothetical protein